MKRKLLLPFVVLSILFTSCNEDDVRNNNSNDNVTLENRMKDKRIQKFSEILSKAIYERLDVREFLKAEALKQFDNDYDVLYYLVKDNMIGNETFKEILVNYSSEEEITDIERNVPLLNILIPEISFFDISAENLDANDKEIPVVFSNDKQTKLYLNGKIDFEFKKDEVPGFHTFVVNENDRVDVNSIKYSTTNNKQFSINSVENNVRFLSPYFDGSKQQRSSLNTNSVSQRQLHNRVIQSFDYYNESTLNKNNPKEISYQRDYIYYGITNKNSFGRLNPDVREYIDYISVNPSVYFMLNENHDTKNKPTIQHTSIVNRRRPLSTEQLIDRMWTKGAYEFKFEIFSNPGHATSIIIPIKPSEIWNFNIKYDRRHGSFWRRSKHTYRIDPKEFTSKVYHVKRRISLEKWNIRNQSLNRFISISEGNSTGLLRETFLKSVTTIASGKFNEGYKLGIGSKVSSQLGGQGSFSEETITQNVFSRNYSDDDFVLAKNIELNFYDPVIVKKTRNNYTLFKYGNEAFSFSIVPGIQ